ncbi:MAG: hypothetical protein ACTHJ6_07655 [Oryzihumus sp.]
MRAGAVPARKAARMLSALAQVRPFVHAEDYEADQHILIPLAVSGTDRELTLATRHLVSVAAPARDTEALAAAQRHCRTLLGRPGAGGVTEFTWRLDPEGAAFVHAAVDALGGPTPSADEPDTRPPPGNAAATPCSPSCNGAWPRPTGCPAAPGPRWSSPSTTTGSPGPCAAWAAP